MIVDDLAYVLGSSKGFMTKDTDYSTWFLALSVGPIINDCPVSGGRVLGGIARAWRASKARLGSHIEALQARVWDLESAAVAREWYMLEEIVRALA